MLQEWRGRAVASVDSEGAQVKNKKINKNRK